MRRVHLKRALPWSRKLHLFDADGNRVDGRLKLPRTFPSVRDGEVWLGDRWFELRTDGHEIWLVEDEEAVAHAKGALFRWSVVAGDVELEIEQKRIGWTESVVKRDGAEIGVVRAQRMARRVTVDLEESLDLKLLLFVSCIALREWRETTGSTTSSSPGAP